MIKSSSPRFNREMHGAKEEKTNRWSDGANVHTHACTLAGTHAPNGALTAVLFLICWSSFSLTRFVAEDRHRFQLIFVHQTYFIS